MHRGKQNMSIKQEIEDIKRQTRIIREVRLELQRELQELRKIEKCLDHETNQTKKNV